jgi:CRISPR-associated protein Cmr1
MTELVCKIRIDTPLFMGGADPRGDIETANNARMEVRAASIRGALRYWLRALCGPGHPVEIAVFGGPSDAGAIALAVDDGVFTTTAYDASRDGKGYLLWSMAKNTREPGRRFVAAETSFKLTLSTLFDDNDSTHSLKLARSALWLLTRFGGIGSRSRRGAGCISVSSESGFPDQALPLVSNATSAAELTTELSKGVEYIRSLVTNPSRDRSTDFLSQLSAECWVLETNQTPRRTWSSEIAAREDIGKQYSLFRPDKVTAQGSAARSWADRIVFGLPMAGQPDIGAVQISASPTIDRRSSPLWLRITRLADGNGYVGVATLFKGTFLPPNVRLYATRKDQPAKGGPIDIPASYGLISAFINNCFSATSVTLP